MQQVIERLSEVYREQLDQINQTRDKLDEVEKVLKDPTTLSVDYFRAQFQIEDLKIELKQKRDFADGVSWAREEIFKMQAGKTNTINGE